MSQGDLVHLAYHGLRQLLAETKLRRDLVRRQVFPAITLQRFRIRAVTRNRYDERYRQLAAVSVRPADHGRFLHARVPVQDFLDLPGENVIPRHQQHFLFPAADVQVTVLVQFADIARVEPAIAQRQGRFLRPVAVTAHHLGAGYPDFALLPGFQHFLAGLKVNHLDLRLRQGDADRGRFPDPVKRVERYHRPRLRLAVTLEYRRAGDPLPLLQDVSRQGRRPGRGDIQAGKVSAGKARVIQ